MKDTSPDVEARYRRMILARSPADRLRMACRMFTTAKTLAKAGLEAEHGLLERGALRRQIFLRFYGADFPPAARDRIADVISRT